MLNYKTSLENWDYLSPVDPFSFATRKIINEQLESDIVLPVLEKSRKPSTTYKLIIKSNTIQYCHYVSSCRIFFRQTMSWKAFWSCNIHLTDPNNSNWKKRAKGQEITSEEETFSDVVCKWMEKQSVMQRAFKTTGATKCSDKIVERCQRQALCKWKGRTLGRLLKYCDINKELDWSLLGFLFQQCWKRANNFVANKAAT